MDITAVGIDIAKRIFRAPRSVSKLAISLCNDSISGGKLLILFSIFNRFKLHTPDPQTLPDSSSQSLPLTYSVVLLLSSMFFAPLTLAT